jgi:hypothetical protein
MRTARLEDQQTLDVLLLYGQPRKLLYNKKGVINIAFRCICTAPLKRLKAPRIFSVNCQLIVVLKQHRFEARHAMTSSVQTIAARQRYNMNPSTFKVALVYCCSHLQFNQV